MQTWTERVAFFQEARSLVRRTEIETQSYRMVWPGSDSHTRCYSKWARQGGNWWNIRGEYDLFLAPMLLYLHFKNFSFDKSYFNNVHTLDSKPIHKTLKTY